MTSIFGILFHFGHFTFNLTFSQEIKINWSSIMIKLPKKNLRTKLKKLKILHNLSTTMFEKMNRGALHSEKLMSFRLILNRLR